MAPVPLTHHSFSHAIDVHSEALQQGSGFWYMPTSPFAFVETLGRGWWRRGRGPGEENTGCGEVRHLEI